MQKSDGSNPGRADVSISLKKKLINSLTAQTIKENMAKEVKECEIGGMLDAPQWDVYLG